MPSIAERIARLSDEDRRQVIDVLRPDDLATMDVNWMFWSRAAQAAPEGDWRTWLILAGRGFGKTRAGAEWVRRTVVCGSLWSQRQLPRVGR
jgi:phage terminase large subunit-like protein